MPKSKGKVALVTGGAGFIGSHLTDRLLREGYRVKLIDNFSSGREENIKHLRNNPNVEIKVGDLKNKRDCVKEVENVDVVFHFAANPEVRVSTTDPRIHFEDNVVATFNLLEAIRIKDVDELVFASSSSVYGEPKEIPVTEEAPISPISIYGASKAACENLILAYSRLYGIKAVVLRYANVVGPRLRHGVIYDFLNKLRRNRKVLEILGDGMQVRSYVYIDSAIDATMVAYEKSNKHFDVYNVGNEDWITVKEVADIVVKSLGLSDVKYVYRLLLHGVGWLGDVKRIALDISKIKRLGWKPGKDSREAVRNTVRDLIKEI